VVNLGWLASSVEPAIKAPSRWIIQAQESVQQRIRLSGAEVAVAFRTLDGRQELLFQPDLIFHAASIMKIPVMIELFAQANAGKLRLEDTVTVTNNFRSIADGSPYQLDAADDSDPGVYDAMGKTMTLRQLCEHMITTSSNLATNLLVEKVGVENIRGKVHQLRADGMQVLRGVEDAKAFAKGLNNTTTARALLRLLECIAKAKGIDNQSSLEMIGILERQQFKEAIPAGLPSGIVVAHKTGEITKIHHDAGIVYARRPFVLVVMVRGLEDRNQSAALIADIAKILYSGTLGLKP
jgi:beta-lactamase class A